MKKVDVSIIVPVYNAETYLSRCLGSILGQIGKNNIEIIAVNDGSTDRSGEILADFGICHPELITILEQPNKGLSSARNLGLDRCVGEFILFVDSDDFIAADMVAGALEFARNQSSDLVRFSYQIGTGASFRPKPHRSPQSKQEILVGKPAAWLGLYKRELWHDVRFPRDVIYEDLATIPFIIAKSQHPVFWDHSPYFYEIGNQSSLMRTYTAKIFCIFPAIILLRDRLATLEVDLQSELESLAFEHVGIGHAYRLLQYPDASVADYHQARKFLWDLLSKNWKKNPYIRAGYSAKNIGGVLGHFAPWFLQMYLSALGEFLVKVVTTVRPLMRPR